MGDRPLAALMGGVAFAIARGGVGLGSLGGIGGGVLLVLLAVFLGEVPVYKTPEGQLAPQGFQWPPVLFAAELAVDVATLTGAWIGAHALRFGEDDLPFYLRAAALPALPLVLAAKVTALLGFGLYRGVWRTIGFKDVATIARAVTTGDLVLPFAGSAPSHVHDILLLFTDCAPSNDFMCHPLPMFGPRRYRIGAPSFETNAATALKRRSWGALKTRAY